MKRMVLFLMVVLLVLSWSPVMANDQMGVGGLWIGAAHSEANSYAMENEGHNGWGLFAHYDADGLILVMKKNWEWGIKPGLSYHYLNWTKSDNKEKQVCDRYHEECTTERYRDNSTVNTQIVAATLKPYITIKDNFDIFAVSGIGVEVSDDGNGNLAVYGGFGAEYFFTKNIGLSLQLHEIYSNPTGSYKRWATLVSAIEYRF